MKLLYKHIWFKLNRPEIDNIGYRLFFEISDDINYKIKILISFMNILVVKYKDLAETHSMFLN